MTKQEIKQAEKEANAYGYPYFNCEKHEAFNDGFLAGANFVNERQPFSAEDMKQFLYDITMDWDLVFEKGTAAPMWRWRGNEEYAKEVGLKTEDDLLKLWEETK